MLASYVPRFYGMRADDVFASTITEDDARLAVARNNRFASWEVLVERATADVRKRPDDWHLDANRRQSDAGH
jgi:hypothetical protein